MTTAEMAVSSAASSTERVSSASRSESASIASSSVNRVSFESFASSFSGRSFSEGHFPGGSSSSRLASDSTYGTPSSSNLTSASAGMYRNDFKFKDASLSRAARSAREAARATSSLWNGMDRVRQNSATAFDRRSFRSSSSRGASTRSMPRRLPISARASVLVSLLSSFRTPSFDTETRAPFGRSASHASANFVSFRRTYRSVASHRLSSCVLSVASSSISHLESIGLNRKYFAFGMSGMSVRKDSSTRSTEQHDSRTTFCKSFSFPPLSALDASRRRGAYAPEPKLTTQSMFLSGHKRRASITPSIAGLLHVTAPSCHLSSPCW
mmetsp:Transcript_3134/g.12560  ORF Transcript_3134/g.12560 Transcript_3134/m.12560 type:complete len:325 (-) Transcript_3134:2946-3920(-)